jgi:DNA topoisomerase-2
VTKLQKSPVVDAVYEIDSSAGAASSLKKTMKAGTIEKYDPALRCRAEPQKCTLILTEGDSAKTLAVSGLGMAGRDYFGIFPLKGVPINARNTARQKVFDNTEIRNILSILNVQPGNLKDLRYGSVAIFADSDVDGIHIAGLIVNFFAVFFPELVKREGFIRRLLSPIIRIEHRRTMGDKEAFFTLNAYRSWEATHDVSLYKIRYLKGLGSNTVQEAKQMFRPEQYKGALLDLFYVDATSEGALNRFFSDGKEEVAARKEMILAYDKDVTLDISTGRASIDDFLDRDLVHFSTYSVLRALPSAIDGLAPGRRKVMFYFLQCAKGNDFEKVAQAGANCAARSNYHHGETSLTESIVGCAQDFVGSGNVALLEPQGMFGSRLLGGKDHAAGRYIFARAAAIAHALFPAEDFPVYDYRNDEGKDVEPFRYVPVLPCVLLNGAAGIGTGFSTTVPAFSVKSVAALSRHLMRGGDPSAAPEIEPSYIGFKGEISRRMGDVGLLRAPRRFFHPHHGASHWALD